MIANSNFHHLRDTIVNTGPALKLIADTGDSLIRDGRPTELPALSTCPLETGPHSIGDHRPLELGKEGQHPEHRSASRCARVDRLLVKVEVNFSASDLAQEFDQPLQAASEAIDTPSRYEIEMPSCDPVEEAIEGRSMVPPLRAGDALVDENLDNVPSEPLTHLSEYSDLVLGGLTVSTDTPIDGNPFADAHTKMSSYIRSVPHEGRGERHRGTLVLKASELSASSIEDRSRFQQGVGVAVIDQDQTVQTAVLPQQSEALYVR